MRKFLRLILFFSIIFFSLAQEKLSGKQLSSNSWIGLELDNSYKITKIVWSKGSVLGLFEGANDSSFVDGVPLYMIKEDSEIGQDNSVEIKCDKKFKYVRYVSPSTKSSTISGLDFYGDSSTSDNEDGTYYQPTNIPLVVVHTDNAKEPTDKNTDIVCNVLVIDGNKKDAEEKGTIKLRGNATTRLEKRPYKLKLEKKTRLTGMPGKSKKWNLLANHSDKTLLRNNLAFKISELIGMPFTVSCKPVDLIFNGEYRGNYGLCDKVEVGEGRVDITKVSENDNSEPEITGGYLFQADAWSQQQRGSQGSYETSSKGIVYVFESPSEEDITSQQKSYLQKLINQYEANVYSGIYDNIDIDSFCKFVLVGELAGNSETFWSTYMFKERSKDKLMFGPVWDFDISFDNDQRVYPTLEKINLVFKYGSSAGTMSTFAVKLLSIENVLQELKNVWKEKTASSLTKEALVNYIDKMAEEIAESAKLNFIRWPVLNQRVLLNPSTRGSFEAEVKYLKDYIQKRHDVVTSVVNQATTTSVQQKVSSGGFGPGGGGRGW